MSLKEKSTDSLKPLRSPRETTPDENSIESFTVLSNHSKNTLNWKSVAFLKALKDRKKSRAKSVFNRRNKVGPERDDAFQFYGQINESDIAFNTYTPPLGHYEFYKGYEEFIDLLKEYQAKGSDEKYDELQKNGLRKMKLELLHRFPWPPKISRNTFWTFGYYRDYYPELEINRKSTEEEKLKSSSKTKSLYERVSSDSDAYFQPRHAADYLDSTDTSSVQRNRSKDSITNNFSDYVYEAYFKQHNSGTIPVPVIEDSMSDVKKTTKTEKHAHIVLPPGTPEEDETETTMTKTSKIDGIGRRATTGFSSMNTSDEDLTDSDHASKHNKNNDKDRRITYTWVNTNAADADALEFLASETFSQKKKKKKHRRKHTKIVYETYTYNPDGTITTELSEENSSVNL